MKRRPKMKNKSHRYNINRPRPKYGYNYTKYKMCLIIMMVIGIKQHLSKIWSSVHEKGKQHWGWVEKKCCLYKKKHVILFQFHYFADLLEVCYQLVLVFVVQQVLRLVKLQLIFFLDL